ncbi:hypothetical protein, partial [Caldithrix abyssi]
AIRVLFFEHGFLTKHDIIKYGKNDDDYHICQFVLSYLVSPLSSKIITSCFIRSYKNGTVLACK